MDSIEPVRPSPPAISPIDAMRVRVGTGERQGSADQRRRRERERRGGNAAEAGGEELPSVVIDAGLLDGSRALDAAERGAAQPYAPAPESCADQTDRPLVVVVVDDDDDGHVDLTV